MTTTYSLNEIDAMCKKAARGAGYPWGLAEEVGRASRWLCAHGFDGTAVTLDLLDELDLGSCAVTQGCHLLDRIELGIFTSKVELNGIRSPLLLTAFVGQAAQLLTQPYAITWEKCSITVGPNGMSGKGTFSTERAQAVRIQSTTDTPISEIHDGLNIEADIWESLRKLAHKTYAPATEASRLNGAGAGLSDQD